MGKEEKRYRAFISYSSKDEEFAQWLHKSLEKYKIPKALYKEYPNIPKKLYPIFRDKYELKSGDDLDIEILKALENSDALIIICSENAVGSEWVNKEIRDFKKLYPKGKLLPIMKDGEEVVEDMFPELLKYKFDENGNPTNKKIDILASNPNSGADGRELAKLKLIAGLLGIPFGEFYRRDEEQKRRDRNRAIGVWGTVFTLMVGLTIFSLIQREMAIDNAQQVIKKNKTLSILTKETINALVKTDTKVIDSYLENILNSDTKELFIKMLTPLIQRSKSLSSSQKQEYYKMFSTEKDITKKQIKKFIKILMIEAIEFRNLDKNESNSMLKLIKKRLKKNCLSGDSQSCLDYIYFVLDYPYRNFFEPNIENESLKKYFEKYRTLVKNNKIPSEYYYLYGKFLEKAQEENHIKDKYKTEKILKLFQKAFSLEKNNTYYIRALRDKYLKQKKYEKALKLAKKVISIEEKKLLKVKKRQRIFFIKEHIIEDFSVLYSIEIEKNPKYVAMLNNKDSKQLYQIINNQELPRYLKFQAILARTYGNNKNYNSALQIYKKILNLYNKYKEKAKINNLWLMDIYIAYAWYQLQVKDYEGAIKTSLEGIKRDFTNSSRKFLETNLAHAYLLSNNFEKAKQIYIKNINIVMNKDSKWEDVILQDFRELQKNGIYNSDFNKIEKIFKEKK